MSDEFADQNQQSICSADLALQRSAAFNPGIPAEQRFKAADPHGRGSAVPLRGKNALALRGVPFRDNPPLHPLPYTPPAEGNHFQLRRCRRHERYSSGFPRNERQFTTKIVMTEGQAQSQLRVSDCGGRQGQGSALTDGGLGTIRPTGRISPTADPLHRRSRFDLSQVCVSSPPRFP